MVTKDVKQTDLYTYRVMWSEEDKEFAGLCAEFLSLSWLADTPEESLDGIRKLVAEVVEDMKSGGEVIPEPLSVKRYSGKFTVRIPPDIHRRLAIQAAEAGVSFNRYINAKLASDLVSPTKQFSQEIGVKLTDREIQPVNLLSQNLTNSESRSSSLTERELTILRLIAGGVTTRELAEQLFVSQAAIKESIGIIFKKINARNRSEAVAEAYKRGIVSL